MKPRRSNQGNQALTLVEVLVIIAVLAILVAMLLPTPRSTRMISMRTYCVNNLKAIGVAYKTWSGDQSDKYPMQVSMNKGGAMELVATGNVAANFLVMSNKLSTPNILYCPADLDRVCVTNFTTGFGNKNISYFVGLDAADEYPQRILSGDDDFATNGVTVKSGLLQLLTNVPVTWTDAARHIRCGNIGFADGSVQQTTSSNLNQWFQQTSLATNRLAIP